MNKNGVIIQDKQSCKSLNIDFRYAGISALPLYPLLGVKNGNKGTLDRECLDISNEAFSKQLSDGMRMPLEFISSYDLFSRYVGLCRKHSIPVRALFIESDYEDEQWDGHELDTQFIGYELSPIPIDDVVVYDLQFSRKLAKFRDSLNKNGLFDTIEQAVAFQVEYMRLMYAGEVGDGEMESFICKVSEVNLTDYL